MDESGTGTPRSERRRAEGTTDRRRRKLARLRGLEAERDEALLAALPPPGTELEGLVLESVLGQGGYGTVYLARRDGRPYAVKFIYLPQAAQWALRELGAMVRMETVGGVGLRGHGVWPAGQPLFQFIVMDYVPGWELYTWAFVQHAPTALETVDVLLDLTQDLGAAHSVGVVHRDVRGDNVLVRETDGRALLVDFGVATFPGAPRATGPQVPGCREYLSPEVVRFNRGEREHHEASGRDDLWALGVVAYRLLTASYPFEGRNAVELERAIVHEAPEPPHVRNPRVPRALSELCLGLLEKEPGARLTAAGALEAALEQALASADAEWDVPLYLQRMAPPPEESATLQPPTREAPPDEDEAGPGDTPAPSRRAWPGWATWALAGLALLLAMGALLTVLHGPPPPTPPVSAGIHPPDEPGASGQEMAPASGGPEGAGGAAPRAAATPAPVARATPAQDTRIMKTPHKPSTTQQAKYQEQHRPMAGGTAGTCVMLWAVGQLACTGPAAQVRPLSPADCPPEAQQAMKEWRLSGTESAMFPVERGADNVTVRRGPGASLRMIEDWGRMPGGSVLTGELVFGEERVYGRFTEARTPEGKWFPVCVQMLDNWDRKRGVKLERRSGPDTAVVYSNVRVEAVRQ